MRAGVTTPWRGAVWRHKSGHFCHLKIIPHGSPTPFMHSDYCGKIPLIASLPFHRLKTWWMVDCLIEFASSSLNYIPAAIGDGGFFPGFHSFSRCWRDCHRQSTISPQTSISSSYFAFSLRLLFIPRCSLTSEIVRRALRRARLLSAAKWKK